MIETPESKARYGRISSAGVSLAREGRAARKDQFLEIAAVFTHSSGVLAQT